MDLRHFQRAIVVLVAFSWLVDPARPAADGDPGRGVVAVHENGKVFVSWRLLGTDNAAMAFNVYRDDGNDRPVKVNGQPLRCATNFIDTGASVDQPNVYFVRPVLEGSD